MLQAMIITTWKDTIKVLCSQGDYSLLQYVKGGDDEWCVALHYDPETKSWASGTYAYSLEGALVTFLSKFDNKYLKNDYQYSVEKKNGVTYERMVELATLFKDGLIEDDEESALEYFDDICDMSQEEKTFFGIGKEED